jgi:hypothetical protein
VPVKLNFTITDPAAIPGPLREYYTKGADGKFTLDVDGHPDTGRVSEFRSSNVELLKERDALKTKYAELEQAGGRVSALEAELAAEKKARTEAEQQAGKSRVRDALRGSALAAGALPGALEILLDRAVSTFTIDGDSVRAKPNIFSPTRPGELLTVEEWLVGEMKTSAFLFKPSSGGGGGDARPGGGGGDGKTVLKNPTPQQLGEHATAIRQGTVRVEYS